MAIWPASHWPKSGVHERPLPRARPVGAKSAFLPARSQSELCRWNDEPAALMSYFAMKVSEQCWRCAISLAPCL